MESGTRLGPYEVLGLIGAGGMGKVYLGRDTRLDRSIAIKVLHQQFMAGPEARERFEREARSISSLNHPNICTLHDVGHQDGVDFIVMEHLQGDTLSERLGGEAMPLEQVLRLGVEIASALHEAHRTGMVHRDLKPANVMLTPQGAKLMDFGLAKMVQPTPATDGQSFSAALTMEQPLTEQGVLMGTLPYMSPEQLRGGEIDARTDIFALGGVLYEMASGKRAFAGSNQADLISAILTTQPQPVSDGRPDVPDGLDHLIDRCLAKDPDQRWHSARDVAGELEWLERSMAQASSRSSAQRRSAAAGYRIEYFTSPDGASIAAARGGSGPPLLIVPSMVDTIETCWSTYAEVFREYELVTYDRRGTGLSERRTDATEADPYLQDAQAVIDGFRLQQFDLLGNLLGVVEAVWMATRNRDRVKHLALRGPIISLADWASIPGVRAARSALEQDWEYFTESFAQFVVGWGNPGGPKMAARLRAVTSRDELRRLLESLATLDLAAVYPKVEVPTLVEHHPGYFFPDSYSQRIASMIPDCRMAVFAGADSEFIADFSIVRDFFASG